MTYQAFYTCHSTDDRVNSESPIDLDRNSVVNVAQQILRDPSDFFGLIDTDGKTLQFYYEESGKILMEMPCPERRVSLGRHISITDLGPRCSRFLSGFHRIHWLVCHLPHGEC